MSIVSWSACRCRQRKPETPAALILAATMSDPDLIAAVATPPGRGGVGIVRLSGQASALREIAAGVARSALPPPRQAVLRQFLDDQSQPIDEGLMLYFPAPHSYTGEHVLELQGHGGPQVLQRLLFRCLALGARIARPGEFTERAFLNGKLDLAQAEAVADLINASSDRSARAAANAVAGKFSELIQTLISDIISLRTLVEGTIDFPEEEIDFLKETHAGERLQRVRDSLSSVLKVSHAGRLLRDGLMVVLVGAPNVGKSSLLNCLAGEDLAIVTDVPGTTRDAIREVIAIDGVPIQIVDTAGLRETADAVERIGIQRPWEMINKADVALLMTDAGSESFPAVAGQLPRHLKRITVINKIDLTRKEAQREKLPDGDRVWLSAKTGAGIDLLKQALWDCAGAQPEGDTVFTARSRHIDALQLASTHLDRAAGLSGQLELFAEELRLAHGALGKITGEFTADDLLGEIFSTFCIGK